MSAWTDCHNHLHDPRLGPPEHILEDMRRAGVRQCVANATREEEWSAVLALSDIRRGVAIRPALGIHPWHAHHARDGWCQRLRCLLEKNPAASIGECGLDGWVAGPPLDVQVPVFRAQVQLARELDRTVTIHCLKSWGIMLELLDELRPPRFLMHAFGGSWETARRLVLLGGGFSFNGHFLKPGKEHVVGVFQRLPPDRIVLESDAPDLRPPEPFVTHPLPGRLNHPANVAATGAALARALGMPAAELAQLTGENAARLFGF